MLDFVVGTKTKPAAVDNLISEIRKLHLDEGTLYVGYPVLTAQGEPISVDAMLTTADHGVVVFDLLEEELLAKGDPASWNLAADYQLQLALALKSRLVVHPALVDRKRRDLVFPIQVLSYAPHKFASPKGIEIMPAYPEELVRQIPRLDNRLPEEQYAVLNAAIQRVTNIKPPKKRQGVKKDASRGAVIKEIEHEIANLDRWQKRGAIESPDGPQRIRGLAGSGKTVVLALKAAYLHTQHPEWRIVVTFYTRSQYQQFRDFIRRFSFEHTSDEPDWTHLEVRHAWGTPREPGLYSQIAEYYNVTSRDLNYAKSIGGIDFAFQAICKELQEIVEKNPKEPLYDAVLIDEAQDLPQPFFRLAHAIAKPPKRVIWAYDELQNLGAYSISPPSVLFGEDRKSGKPLVELKSETGEPSQDVILPICYRNTPWALATAHALGFGIYRDGGLVQFFDEPTFLEDVGYEVTEGELKAGKRVVLRRRDNSSPGFFKKLLKPEDSLLFKSFESPQKAAVWTADSIQKDIVEDELEPSDVLVIFPEPYNVVERSTVLMAELRKRRISAHIAGVTSSRDEFFMPDSVTISGIYRAKGNEAPMVYVLDSEYCFTGTGLARKRGTLFTAITRSRAWVRIIGAGPEMEGLLKEIRRVVANEYRLDFVIPKEVELENMRRLHRDMTSEEKAAVTKATKGLESLLAKLESGELAEELLPPDLRERLRKHFGKRGDE